MVGMRASLLRRQREGDEPKGVLAWVVSAGRRSGRLLSMRTQSISRVVVTHIMAFRKFLNTLFDVIKCCIF